MSLFVKLYLIALPIFFILDFIWLGLIARKFYLSELGLLMKTNINWVVAIIFYLIFIIGLVIFAIAPAVKNQSLMQAIILGGLFGFFAYATYDLTNLATLKNWPVPVSIVDMIWGVLLAGSVSTVTFFIASKLGL